MLAGQGDTSKIVYNELRQYFQIMAVIEEGKPSGFQLIKKRITRLGLRIVFGQILFILYLKYLKKVSSKKIDRIKKSHNLDDSSYSPYIHFKIDSVNNNWVAKKLNELKPDIVIVNGTRIIHESILSSLTVPFVNIHAGITPCYRGVHGGYWALAENNPHLCGVTVHLIDTGIDTGKIIHQSTIQPTKQDNFLTYPYLQIAAALPILRRAIDDISLGKLKNFKSNLPSKLYSHPTLFEYLKNYVLRKVK